MGSKSKPTSTLDPEVIVRQATEQDTEALLHLSRISHKTGYTTDYLSGWLPKFLKDPNRIIAIAEKNKQIIGMAMILGNMDGGVTVQGEAGRTHPDYQGTGVLARCQSWLSLRAEIVWPNWKRFHSSSTQTNYYDTIMDQIDMLTERTAYRIKFSMSNLKTFMKSIPLPQGDIRRISHSELKRILSLPDVTSRLYPDGFIVLEHMVFVPEPSNASLIEPYHDNIFIDGSDVISSNSISIGGSLSCDDEHAYRYNFNYSGVNDMNLCLSHLYSHLNSFIRKTEERDYVYLILMIPFQMEVTHGKDTLLRFWNEVLPVSPEHVTHLHQYVFEYPDLKRRFVENSKVDQKKSNL